MNGDPRIVAEESGSTTYVRAEETAQERAFKLQAAGPDEFPYGYYLYLALAELENERAKKDV